MPAALIQGAARLRPRGKKQFLLIPIKTPYQSLSTRDTINTSGSNRDAFLSQELFFGSGGHQGGGQGALGYSRMRWMSAGSGQPQSPELGD